MATRLLPPGYQLLDANGNPISGAKIQTYEAGTSTPKNTYSDGGATIPNANPIVADSAGRFGAMFAAVGDYRMVFQDATGATLFTSDPVSGDTSSATVPGSGFRNILINGDFSINQRQATSVANDTYCLDGWYVLTSTGNVTVARNILQANGIPTNIRLTQPDVAAKRMGLAQIVLGANCRFQRASSVVLSGMVRSSAAVPIRYAILSWTGTVDTVTSDVVNDWTSSSYTAGGFFLGSNVTVQAVGAITPSAATWTAIPQISSTMSAALNNAIVFFWTEGTAAQNQTFDIANVQLEQGATATGFEYTPEQAQLQRCYPYYRKSFSMITAPAQNTEPNTATRFVQSVGASTLQDGMGITLGVPMRSSGYTMTIYNPSAANAQIRNITTGADCTGSAVVFNGVDKFRVYASTPAGSAAGNALAVHWTLDDSL